MAVQNRRSVRSPSAGSSCCPQGRAILRFAGQPV